MTDFTRRSLLRGLGAGLAHWTARYPANAAAALSVNSGKPGKLNLKLRVVTSHVLRICVAPAFAASPEEEPGAVTGPHEVPIEGKSGLANNVDWGRFTIRIEELPLRIAVVDPKRGVRQEIQFDTDSTAVRFRLGSEPLFGLGEGLMGINRRGAKVGMSNGQDSFDLRAAGSRVPIPWLMSPEGWGIFVGLPLGTFDLTGDTGVVRSPVATSTHNVYLVLGDSPAEVLRGFADVTGYPHLPPLWSLGYMQSHRTLASRDEVMGIARTFREKKLPCDALIYLGTGFCPSGWNTGHGSFTFNSEVFPNPEQALQELHEANFKVVLHVVPPHDFHGKITDTGSAARTQGDAVPYWAEHMPLEDAGVDGWWPDEGDMLPVEARLERNEFYWDGQIKAHPDRRPFALHRNGYAGLQRYGWLWSGDVDSTWKTLAAQVTNGINVGLCGIPYWGTDTGGFVPTRELTPELFVRWFQFSAFSPLFRSHGRTWKLRLPWGWNLGAPGPLEGAERPGDWPRQEDLHNTVVETVCRKYLDLRYSMLPYIYSAAEQAHRTGMPLMRALWIEFPQDPKTLSIEDEYIWGDHFLVAPVLEPGAARRSIYLPEGAWWDFWSHEKVQGGTAIERKVDLSTLPLYVRAGATVPFGAARQYALEPAADPVTLRVYPGADGLSSWYEDDGISFQYKLGQFARIECAWQESSRKLTLTHASGSKQPSAAKEVRVQAVDTGTSKLVSLAHHMTVVEL